MRQSVRWMSTISGIRQRIAFAVIVAAIGTASLPLAGATVLAADTTAPDTFIDSSPPVVWTSKYWDFTFHGVDDSGLGLRFECQLNGSAWSACDSPSTVAVILDTNNTFSVRAIDAAGNVDATAATVIWSPVGSGDTTAPTVTIDQAPMQSDPTGDSPVEFMVIFSEPMFRVPRTTVSGTAGPTGAEMTEVAPFDKTTFRVLVSGMTASGTVIATVAADAGTDLSDNWNVASTSTDNTVTYELPASPSPDTGTVAAQVTIPNAQACLELSTSAVDFGTLALGAVDQPATPAVTVSNCSGADESVLARGTDATATGATWTLDDTATTCTSTPTPLAPDRFRLAVAADPAAPVSLSADNKSIETLAAGATSDHTLRISTACPGSSGGGLTMAMQVIYLAVP